METVQWGDTVSIKNDEIATSGFALLAMTGWVPECPVKICRNPLWDKEVDVQEELKVEGSRMKVGEEFWVHDPQPKTVGDTGEKRSRYDCCRIWRGRGTCCQVPCMSPKLGMRRDMINLSPIVRSVFDGAVLAAMWRLGFFIALRNSAEQNNSRRCGAGLVLRHGTAPESYPRDADWSLLSLRGRTK